MTIPLRVLIVEDNEDDALFMLRELKRGGYEVTSTRVETAEEMRAALLPSPREAPPKGAGRGAGGEGWDLVIADFSLPHFSGPQALEVLHESGLDLPFIIMSGTINEENAVAALRAGAHDFITKGKWSRLLPAIEREMQDAQVRRQRRQAEQQVQTLIESMPDGVLVVNAEGNIVVANAQTEALFGYRREELLGKSVEMLLPDRIRAIHPRHRDGYLAAPKARTMGSGLELYARRKDGSEFPVDISLSAMETKEGVAAISVVRDITARKQAEEQIQRQVETLGALYDLSRTLSEMEDFNAILDVLTRRAVEATHVTFARVLLLENGDLVAQAVYPVRVLDRDLQVGQREPLAAHPFCQRVMDENAPLVLQTDSPEASDCAPFFLGIAQTLCVVPLRARERPLGLLVLGEVRDAAREPFTADKMRLARSIGDQAASTLHRALLYEETQRRLRNIQALRDIDRAITGSMDLSIVLKVVLEQVVSQLKVDAAAVLLFNPHTQTLEYTAGRGFRSKGIERSRLRLGEGHAGRAALERRLVSVHDLREEGSGFVRANLLAGEEFDCYHAVPLIAKGQVKGVLEVFLRSHRTADVWLDFLETLAGQAAIAVDNANLFTGLQRANTELVMAYDATIEGWSHAMDLRDKETEGHTLRVTELTLQLARTMGISEAELVHVRRGALLHDMGKMGIPDNILHKPGALTDEEWVIMRRHPQFAFDMLSPIAYLRPALDIPYSHHEKWDGSGYPRGLIGEQIPLAARIFAVVDVWDALRSDRPYRAAWPKEKVIEHIQAGAGSHFDSKVVEIFLQVMGGS